MYQPSSNAQMWKIDSIGGEMEKPNMIMCMCGLRVLCVR